MGILDVTSETPDIEGNYSTPERKKKSSKFASLFGILLLIVLAVFGSLYVIRIKPELLGLAKSTDASRKEVEELIYKVGKIIELPEGETPTVATVNDLNQTQDKDFFRKAQEGDKVLVYQGAKRAYLYRPSTNKIIEVGVVNAENNERKSPEVSGKSTDIEVISPTPLPQITATPVFTSTPKPTNTPTRVSTPIPLSPTATLTPSP